MPTRTHMRHQASIFPQTLPPALYDIFLAHPEVQRDAGFEHIDSPPDSLGGVFGPTPQREIRENHRVAVTPYAGEAPDHAQLLTKINNCKTSTRLFSLVSLKDDSTRGLVEPALSLVDTLGDKPRRENSRP